LAGLSSNHRGSVLRGAALVGAMTFSCLLARTGIAAEPPIQSDRPNAIAFPEQDARFVRFVIQATSDGGAACLDELEVYGSDPARNLALARDGGKAFASSCIQGYDIHAVPNLNDGEYGNDRSWIAAGTGEEWAQIELRQPAKVSKVVFSRDRARQHADRVPVAFEIRLSLDGKEWRTARKVATTAARTAAATRFGGSPPSIPNPPPPPRRSRETVGVTLPKVLEPPGGRVGLEPSGGILRDELGFPNLARSPQARAAASSVLAEGGMPIHQIAHLNDGLTGNSRSWISKGEPSWAEVDLGDVYWVYKAAFGSDSSQQYGDRAATAFSILAATRYGKDSQSSSWQAVHRQTGGAAVHVRTEFPFRPVQARWVRIAIDASAGGEARIDELEVFGQKAPIPSERIEQWVAKARPAVARVETEELLRYAFLGEEHAWAQAFGRADLDPSLVPYNGRVKEYPRHVGDDRIPLPPLPSAPKLNGALDDPCWAAASRGVVRVSAPTRFERGPLVNHELLAGWHGGDLFLAVRTDELLSSHIAVVSDGAWGGCGVVAWTQDGLVLNTYGRDAEDGAKSVPVEGAFNRDLTIFEMRLPLSLFPAAKERGLRVGLGLGGRYTSSVGRSIGLTFSALSVAEQEPCVSRTFRVRLAVAPGGDPVEVTSNAPGLENGVTLAAGQSKVIAIPARRGAIGSEFDLAVSESGREYALHLFRYDPLERTLTLMGDLIGRLAAKGLDVASERGELSRLRERQESLLAAATPDLAAERKLFFEARVAKRRLFFRDPDLCSPSLDSSSVIRHSSLGLKLLFVARHPFLPSHIYTDYTDAPFRPGGGIYTLEIPRRDGRLEPAEAKLTRLFEAKGGIARNPVATFDLRTIFFGHRPSADGYYHITAMNADGSNLRQITDGPYHDFYPCPLPDGGVAFISTRCVARVFCFRGGSSVLFRMNPDGSDIRPLSLASLSEWAPSVMRDGRILWTRWEYIDKGADFGQTLWAIRPDGSHPEHVFGNTIIQPNGYASGHDVPGTGEIACTLVSHFGDINGPIALLDIHKGRFNPKAITSLTPEVPWPGMWPRSECFRDPVPLARDYFLCSHAPLDRFGLYVIDRFGNREFLHFDPTYGCMCPQLLRPTAAPPPLIASQLVATSGSPLPKAPIPSGGYQVPPPLVASQLQEFGVRASARTPASEEEGYGLKAALPTRGEFILLDVYRGLEPRVARGTVKYLRVVEEVRHEIEMLPNGEYRKDHADFMKWYASPVDVVSSPYGWPSYTAKASHGLVPVEEDGSAHFYAPAGKVLFFQVLDKDFNELQRMRSVVQLQPGEVRGCIGCHENRSEAPPVQVAAALRRPPREPEPPTWGAEPFAYERVVQPVLDAKCVRCHNQDPKAKLDLRGTLDANRVPASYRGLLSRGWVHVIDCGWNSAGCEKRDPLTFGTLKSRLWPLLAAGHYDVKLTADELLRLKTWIDLNCPLWPDYIERSRRPGPAS